MKVKWDDKALFEWEKQIYKCLVLFGKDKVKEIQEFVKAKLTTLETFPEMGTIEQNLKFEETEYRSLKIGKHNKIIYYIDYNSDTVFIVDVWDTKMHPTNLRIRITNK